MDCYRKASAASEKFDTGAHLFFRFLLFSHYRSVPRNYRPWAAFASDTPSAPW